MELIITGGNKKYYNRLNFFLKTLRERGKFSGEVIVCDNTSTMQRSRNFSFLNRHKIDFSPSFTDAHKKSLQSYGAKIVTIGEIFARWGVDIGRVTKIYSEHPAHPLKFIYCTLLAKENFSKFSNIAFVDADVFFQDEFSLKEFSGDSIHLASEGTSIGSTKHMVGWMQNISLSSIKQNLAYDLDIKSKPNLCTGFFAGSAKAFLNFSEQCWNLSEASSFRFHSDQPLANYLIWHLGYPYVAIDPEYICHMAYVSKESTGFSENPIEVIVNGKKPPLVHYHGWIQRSIDASLNSVR